MKLFVNSFLFLLALIIFENRVLSLNDYQIKEYCQKKSRRSFCIKNLREKKLNLLKGQRIEIEVVPFKNN